MTASRRDLQGLQFLRAIAVLLVVCFHAMGILSKNEYFGAHLMPETLYKRGAVGVDLFFVISGFIIAYVSLADGTLRAKLGFGDFVMRRVVRIIPFLWFAVLLYAATRFATTNQFEAIPYLNSMFPIIPVGELRPNVVWTLRHELWFYGLFGISFLLRKRMPWLVYMWAVIPIAAWPVLSIVGSGPDNEFVRFLISPWNFNFAVGLTIGLLYKRYGGLRDRLSSSRAIAWVGVVAATVVMVLLRNEVPTPVVALVAGVVVLFGLAMPTSKRLPARTWELLGDASYSIYLLHNIAVLLGAELWIRVLGDRLLPVAFVVIAVAATMFGVVLHLWVEKPLLRAVNKLVRRPQRTAITPSENGNP